MNTILKYAVVGTVLLSLGGCFVPVGGGYYGRGRGDDDDSYRTLATMPHVTTVDWPQVYRGYVGPNYWYRPERRDYRDNNRDYYQNRRYEQRQREEEHHRDDGGDE